MLFGCNIMVGGGMVLVCMYILELLFDVLSGIINLGFVFDFEFLFDDVVEGYVVMDECCVIKFLLWL